MGSNRFRSTLSAIVVLIGAALALAACAEGDEPPPTPSPSAVTPEAPIPTPDDESDPTTGDPGATQEALDAIEAFDPDDVGTISALNQAVSRGNVAVPELALALDVPESHRRWAAVYLIALLASDSDDDIEVLAGILNDPDPTLRVVAAGSLAGLGDKRALPALIDALELETHLPYDRPGRLTRDFAHETLVDYTGESFNEIGDWRNWWADVEDSIQWDGEQYVVR